MLSRKEWNLFFQLTMWKLVKRSPCWGMPVYVSERQHRLSTVSPSHLYSDFWSDTVMIWRRCSYLHQIEKAGLWLHVTLQPHKSSSAPLKLSDCIQMKDEKLTLEFMFTIKFDKQILMTPSAICPVLSSSVCAYHLFRGSRCTLRFTFSVYVFPSITAHITLQ